MTCNPLGPTERKRGFFKPLFYFLFLVSFLSDGADSPVPLAAVRIVVCMAFLCSVWFSAPCEKKLNAADLLVLLFWGISGASLLRAGYPWVAYQWFINITCAAAVYLMARTQEPADGPTFWRAGWALLGAVAVFQVFLQAVQTWKGAGRPAGTFVNPNFLGEFLLLAAVGLFYLFRSLHAEGGRVWQKGAAAGGAAIALAGGWMTSSRGVFLVGLLVLSALTLREYGWRRSLPLFLGLFVSVVFLGKGLFERFTGSGDPYAYYRLDMWRTAGRMVLDHPLGVGVGNFLYTWFQLRGPVEGTLVSYSKYTTNPHNEFLSVLAELGIPGGLVFLGLAGLLVMSIRRAWKSDDPVLRCSYAMLCVSALHSLVDFNFHLMALLLLNAVLLGSVSTVMFPPLTSFRWRGSRAVKGVIALFLIPVVLYSVLTAAAMHSFWKGEKAMIDGKPEEAERYIRLAHTLDPPRAVYPDGLAALYFQEFRKTKRREWLDRALEAERDAALFHPSSFKFQLRIAFLQTLVARTYPESSAEYLSRAEASFDRALALYPYYVFTYYLRASFLLDEGRTGDAIRWMERGLDYEPNFPLGYVLIGEACQRENRLADALRMYRKGLDLGEFWEGRVNESFEREFLRFDKENIRDRVREIEAILEKGDRTNTANSGG